MPNHIKNVLTFKKLKPKDKEFILNNFTIEEDTSDIFPFNRRFDFDKIIPEPRLEKDCPADCIVNKDSGIMIYEDRPWFDWYKWHNRFWGTKWNAYDSYVNVGVSTVTFVFSTAWGAPHPIYEQLCKSYPDLIWTVKYADEDYGSNCGTYTYDPKKTGCVSLIHKSRFDMTYPDSFARKLWRTY